MDRLRPRRQTFSQHQHTQTGDLGGHVAKVILIVKETQIKSQEDTMIGWDLLREMQGPTRAFALVLKSVLPLDPRAPKELVWLKCHSSLAWIKHA